MKKPVTAVKLSGKSSYLTNRDIKNLIEAHDHEIQQMRTELMKLTTLLEVITRHMCFEFALRPVGSRMPENNNNNEQPKQPQEPVVVDETKLTPEQQLELQRLRSETEAAKAKSAESAASLETMRAERRVVTEKLAFTKAISDCGVKFHSSPTDTEALLRGRCDILTDDEGNVIAFDKTTGKSSTVAEALKNLALDNPAIADGRSLRHLRGEVEMTGTPVVRSKADFKSDEQKRSYIRTKGLDAFEKLPLRPVDLSTPKTFEQFTRLPISEKTKLISQHGDGYVKGLPRENDLIGRLGRAGIKTNKTGR